MSRAEKRAKAKAINAAGGCAARIATKCLSLLAELRDKIHPDAATPGNCAKFRGLPEGVEPAKGVTSGVWCDTCRLAHGDKEKAAAE